MIKNGAETNSEMISEEALDEFKSIWKEEYNEDISDDFAMETATALLTMMNHIYRPVKKSWLKEFEEQNGETKVEENKIEKIK
ncbi:MAG: hypothetical protein ABR875_01145 [Minisyncoccia bacterium]|jgi:hypothetical protein